MSSELPLSTYSGFCLSQISSKVFCQKKSSLRAHFILLLLLSLPCWWWPSSKKVSGKCPDGRTDSPVSSLNHLTPFLPQISFLLTFRLTPHWLAATSESYFCHTFSVSKQVNFRSSWDAFCSFSWNNKNVWCVKVWVFCSYFLTYLHVTKEATMARKDYGFESLLSGTQISLLIESCVQFFVNVNINFRSRPCLLSTCYQSIRRKKQDFLEKGVWKRLAMLGWEVKSVLNEKC